MHNACMAVTVTIRDVPNATRDELAARAALAGKSLQEYLRAELIDLARRPTPEALMQRIRERKARTRTVMAAEDTVAYRDQERP